MEPKFLQNNFVFETYQLEPAVSQCQNSGARRDFEGIKFSLIYFN